MRGDIFVSLYKAIVRLFAGEQSARDLNSRKLDLFEQK